MKQKLLFTIFTVLFSFSILFAGTTGKISGTVLDAETGERLPGVNIVIQGTNLGSASDMNGYYVILNVPPGSYNVQADMMGYTSYQFKEVRVKIDLTTSINFSLSPTVLAGEAVTIVAERPVVEMDVAASQTNMSTEHIQALPVSQVSQVVGLKAGVTSGLSFRGSGSDQALVRLDGITMKDERDHSPISTVPLSAVQEISLQSGGFAAEYNNVRAGIVNVVTREGELNKYSGTFIYKNRPAGPKHFGISPYESEAFWLRPYLDDAVCWTGTKNGAWDKYTQRQYPEFSGWDAISAQKLNDDDPTNDLTPAAAQRIFEWEHRKQGDIDKADYDVDAGFGGPVPFVSDMLGNLRFYASYKKTRDMYLFQVSRDALTNETYMLNLTSDVSPSTKISLKGFYGELFATAQSRSGGTTYMDSPYDLAYEIDRAGFTVPWRLFTDIYWSSTARYLHSFSLKMTRTVSSKTFYEFLLTQAGTKYFTSPGDERDAAEIYEIFDGYYTDEAPIGFEDEYRFGIDGLGMGGPVSTSRDYSRINTTTARFDLVNQFNSNNQFKTGFELLYNHLDLKFGSLNKVLPEGNTWTEIDRSPFRLTAYFQDKLEFKGLISTLGLIMEYSNPNGDWYDVTSFDKSLYSQNYTPEADAEIPQTKAESKIYFSPRLGVSHPITERSKLYFNYGHYRQIPTSQTQFRIQRASNNKLDYIGDPTLEFARTVAYELGYDHALFTNYLLHLAAYYKDITDQEDWTRFISLDGKINYYKLTNNNYEDIRGLEIEVEKKFGKWVVGNLNYEYRVQTSGYFGVKELNQNPADQREYLRNNPVQSKPRPQPRFKSYIDLHTPMDFGPSYVGLSPLADWNLSLKGVWTAGSWFTWNPNTIPGVEYNVQWKNYYNIDIKLSKAFPVGKFRLNLFVDIYNILNTKDFSGVSFYDSFDYNYYMKSLHLPASIGDELGYGNIPGDDRPGDVRKEGVEYQPVEWVPEISSISAPGARAIYYDAGAKKYYQYVDNNWVTVSQSRMDKILEDKAYIDMPNQTYFTFLNPRNTFFGIRLDYNF